jgi:phosphoserine phosphatase RsbU/P
VARQVRAELQIAAQIQRGLMAVKLPQLRYAEVDADSLPCKEIGGDFYDVLVIDGALHVVVADVSGKGVSAALLGAMLQGLVHAQLLAGEPLDRIASSANEFLCGRELGKYATMVLLRLQPDGRCEYINCGHVRPFRQGDQHIDVLTNSNMPVGLIAGAAYSCEAMHLLRDERVVIVTDGMTEAEDAGGQCYGDARLEAGLLNGAKLQELLEELRAFTCGQPLEDDCTAMEVRFLG